MISSRSISDLLPEVGLKATLFLNYCRSHNVDALIHSTYRDYAAQTELYSIGRTKAVASGPVTNAQAGYSYHNFRRAFNAVPLVCGKPLWTVFKPKSNMMYDEWLVMRDAGNAADLEWAGYWRSFREYGHWQFTGGYTLEQLRSEVVNSGKG